MNGKIVSLIPHKVTVLDVGGCPLAIMPSGKVVRCHEMGDIIDHIEVHGAPVRIRTGKWVIADDLPPPKEGVLYLVNSLTAQAIRESSSPRSDLLYPASRNEDGHFRYLARV